jgi:hypothetical protein
MITKDPNPGLEGHVFPSPVDAEGYMVMLCYKNGSLTREGSVILLIIWCAYSLFTYTSHLNQMVLVVSNSGSLFQFSDVRNRYAEKSWDVFNKLLQQTQPLNGGKLGFYYKEHEILPPLPGHSLIFPPIKLLVLDTKLILFFKKLLTFFYGSSWLPPLRYRKFLRRIGRNEGAGSE